MLKVGSKEIAAIYEFCREVNKGTIQADDAATQLKLDLDINMASSKMYFYIYKAMLSGDVYKRATSAEMTEYFIRNIAKEYGIQAGLRAIKSVESHKKYFEGLSGTTLKKLGDVCKRMQHELAV